MSRPFAEGTTIAPEKSQADIAALLMRYGATGYSYGWDNGKGAVMFRAHERIIRFVVPMPDPTSKEFRRTPSGRSRNDPRAAYDAEVRRRWRALVLVIKAKLEAVSTGVTTFEEEFLAHVVLPSGETLYEATRARLELAYESGDPVDILPGLPRADGPRAISGAS